MPEFVLLKKKGIAAPRGFKAAGVACGIKQSGKLDLALIYSEVPATVAGVFTSNQVKAAPVIVSRKQIKSGYCQAIISNAGSANCQTGEKGMEDAWKMVKETARVLAINPHYVLVSSTGSIGKPLPMTKIIPGIAALAEKLSKSGGGDASDAILTTDTRRKEIAVKVDGYMIAGNAKGSGMIHPNMATMHSFITTDVIIDRGLLQKLLGQAVRNSFNMITVDQCQSTNDCVFVLANGLSGKEVKSQESIDRFYRALEYVCTYLAKEIARDGEGATQLMEVRVSGARSEREAKCAARMIAASDLLKCAVYGKDRNLGRIFAAAGASCARFNAAKIKADMKLGKKETIIVCDLGAGDFSATAWGCDMTEGYIKINADYHT